MRLRNSSISPDKLNWFPFKNQCGHPFSHFIQLIHKLFWYLHGLWCSRWGPFNGASVFFSHVHISFWALFYFLEQKDSSCSFPALALKSIISPKGPDLVENNWWYLLLLSRLSVPTLSVDKHVYVWLYPFVPVFFYLPTYHPPWKLWVYSIIFNCNEAHRVQSRISPFQFVTLQEGETRLPLSLIYQSLCL